jgi:hypothetical protein
MPTAAVKTQVCANKIGTLPGAFGGAWVVAGPSGYPRQMSTYIVEEGFFLYFLAVFFLVFAPAF